MQNNSCNYIAYTILFSKWISSIMSTEDSYQKLMSHLESVKNKGFFFKLSHTTDVYLSKWRFHVKKKRKDTIFILDFNSTSQAKTCILLYSSSSHICVLSVFYTSYSTIALYTCLGILLQKRYKCLHNGFMTTT